MALVRDDDRSARGADADRVDHAGRESATPTAMAPDDALLRAFEPILRFTYGELFFPTAVEGYVELASLWALTHDGAAHELVAAGELDIHRLIHEATTRPDAELSLRFVDARLGRAAYRTWRNREERPVFRSGGRFTRVGMLARVIDSFFRLGLLLRGRVPGGLAAAAEVAYRTHLSRGHPYYGHVTRDGGYVVLQYWFFYAMNDWRSTFGGANDHEADWEQVSVYLAEQHDGTLVPAWVAFSSHDATGDDLRRRWDDPELSREGDHAVVFVGAGSHSGAVLPGDYVSAIDPPGAYHHVLRVARRLASVVTPWSRGAIARGIGVPFIDYHRGDGDEIGPGRARTWAPVVIDDETPWVRDYRGLWGLDTRDRFGGERAPAGPRYERGGTVRRSWADPLGWCGLQKVPPCAEVSQQLLRASVDAADDEVATLTAEIEQRRHALRQAAVEADVLAARSDLRDLAIERRAHVRRQEAELSALVLRRTQRERERAAHRRALAQSPPPGEPSAHLRRRATPIEADVDTRTRVLRVWATVSTPLLFAAAAFLLVDPNVAVASGAVGFTVVFLAIEAVARRRFVQYATTLALIVVAGTLALALARGVVGRWHVVLAFAFGAAATATLAVNLRDLRRRR